MDDGNTHEALRRIAVLLLALAALAERAAGCAAPVRCLVLWFLRPAAAAASALAAEAAPLVPVGRPGNDPDDAAGLALKFRALAIVFFALSHRVLRLVRRRAARQPDPARPACSDPDRRPGSIAAHRPRAPPTRSPARLPAIAP